MKKFIICFFASVFTYNAVSQGCSDAGFCSAGNLKPLVFKYDTIKNKLNFSLNYSIGERGTVIIAPQFEPLVKVSDKSFIQIKIPYIQINGKLGSTKGLGDVIINYNYIFDSLFKYKLSLTGGIRIASGSSSMKSEAVSLPMPYQVSLGTTDFFAGLKLDFIYGLSFALVFQTPMFNINQNGFDSSAFKYFKNQKNIEDNKNYFISSHIVRKSDIMIRVDKVFSFNKIKINAGLIPIYHLGKDKVNISSTNQIKLENSQGLTLNVSGSLDFNISNKSQISVNSAFPVVSRKSRPDGLGRSLVTFCTYKYEL